MSLAIIVALVFSARLGLDALPLRRLAMPITATGAVLFGVGVAGLALHCLAMFFPSLVEPLPGADVVTAQIRALGTASIIWYVVPAGLVLIGLRRQHPVAIASVTVALAAVGVTMYNGGPLPVHLFAIFVAVLVFAGVAATLLIPPWQRSSPPRHVTTS
ncbi:MAG: hypothetical protein WKF73_05895 [Nocardioidaceae bacterium]